MSTRRYAIVQAPALACYSRGFYRDVALNWRGAAFLYLLLLLAVCWLPDGWKTQRGWERWADGPGASLAAQIPPIAIRHGVASVDAPQPYYVTDVNTKRVLAILDTSGAVPPLNRTGAVLFLGKDQMVLRKSDTETRVYRLNGVNDFVFDRSVAERWLRISKRLAGPFVYLTVLVGSYLFRVVEAVVLGSIGIGLSRALRAGLGFAATTSVSVMALTFPILARTVMRIAGPPLPHFGWISFGATLAYLGYGIAANRSPMPGVAAPPSLS